MTKVTRVFILGSGFSAEAGAPLSSQILKRIFSPENQNNRLWRLYEWLDTRLFAARPGWLGTTEFEEVLSRLNLFDYYVQEASIRSGLEENIDLLLREFIKLLDPLLLSPLPQVYSHFVNKLTVSDAILTFNYDLVLESALEKAGMAYDYQLPLWPGHPVSPNHSEIPVAKLHGSINIAHCSKCNRLYYLNRPFSGEGKEQGPFIIPPTLFKSYSLPALRRLWYLAYCQLRQAEEIIIIGYSLPSADILAAQLLFFAAQSKGLPRVTLVNGKASDERPFRDIFGDRLFNSRQTLPEWLGVESKDQE
ncbi:MAG TPA: SIR2 family protein [Bacillota bacterium]|nr:SIR2 family protein [Bacillota bacterium]